MRGIGTLLLIVFAFCFANHAKANPADRDMTFGTSGVVDLQFPGWTEWRTGGLAIQSDHKLVVSAACRAANGVEYLCITRRLENGDPDPVFGTQGTISTTDAVTSTSTPMIVIQPGGKLVVAATCTTAISANICAIRLNADGTRDTSFGTNGKVVLVTGDNSFLGGFSARANGRLVFAGACVVSAVNRVCAARIDADGAMDASFGVNGVAILASQSAIVSFQVAVVDTLSDGKLIVAMSCQLSSSVPSRHDVCLFRLLGNGSNDTAYGESGLAVARISADGFGVKYVVAAVQSDDSVIIAGACGDPDRFCLARTYSDGSLDTKLSATAAPSAFRVIRGLRVQSDGKIIAAGSCEVGASAPYGCWLRYNSDRSVDATLLPVEEKTSTAASYEVLIQTDGKIIVSNAYYALNGQSRSSIGRYEGGPFGNLRCSLDVDGDGSLNPLIDGLIITRAVIGFTGPRVYAGIAFPAAAKRTQWGTNNDNDIRQFLVSQCGMKL